MTEAPVDGFTVEHAEGLVVLTLSNRYGESDAYSFSAEDAARIARAMIRHSEPGSGA